MGEVAVMAGDQRKRVKVDDRLRVGSTVITERRSLVTLLLSNGATLELGPESELEIEEFGQAGVSSTAKLTELKEEPTISRTRLRLLRGDVSVDVKPLKVARGSSFTLTMFAGTIRLGEGKFRAVAQMSELGVGVCTMELQSGAADFEVVGASYARLPAGRKLAFAVEQDKTTGVIKVGEMPKDPPPAKK